MTETTNQLILIIEDDEFLRSLVAKRLEQAGFRIAVAVDGESGLAVAADSQPALILLDLLLPGMDGYEFLEKIKARENLRSIPVVAFSNLGQREDIEKAKTLGADDFLIKANFTLDELVLKIEERLGKPHDVASGQT